MTENDALSWAEDSAAGIKSLSQIPIRTKPARIAEALARKFIALDEAHVDRPPILAALLNHITPVLRRCFFQSSVPRFLALESEDFMQDAYLRIILLLNRYFDPKRGSFISYAVMAAKQLAATVAARQYQHEGREVLLYEQGETKPSPEPAPFLSVTKKHGPQQNVLGWLEDFVVFLDTGGLHSMARVAHVHWWTAQNLCEFPSTKTLGRHLGISTQRAAALRKNTFQVFRDFVEAYIPPAEIQAANCWVASVH